MTGDERPDIYDDGLREERCENCLRCDGCRFASLVERIMGSSGDVREIYCCVRQPKFVYRTRAEARCNYWEAR